MGTIALGHNQQYYAIQGVADSGVHWTNPDGSVSSASVTDPDVAAWLASGHRPADMAGPDYGTRYSAALAAGLAVTSTGTPLINDTYPIDPGNINTLAVAIYLRAKSGLGLPGGVASITLPNLAGTAFHSLTATNVANLGDAITEYLVALTPPAVEANGWPASNVVTIP